MPVNCNLDSFHCPLIKFLKVPAYVLRLVRTRGLKKALLKLYTEMYSTEEYIITHHDMNSLTEIHLSEMDYDITELTKDQERNIESLCKVWPSEFGQWKPEHLKAMLASDLENDNWCFFARRKDNVIGAVWVFKKDEILANCPVNHIAGERVVGRTFVVPEERGKGLSKLLYAYAVKIAYERKVPQLFGLTYPRRKASIKSKLGVGFNTIGSVTVKTRFGREKYQFSSNNQQ